MRYMLVDGHGNFGSVDGDPPAAYRYTEARLAKIAGEMLRDIEKDTVDWDPNFDESRKEPRVLPCRFPNLLVNGSSGIAVGMATNIPPHNLREVIGACICVLDNPDATLADLMEHVRGPDFPTKGIIMGRSGIRAAYATGRGKVTVRARADFEEFGNLELTQSVTDYISSLQGIYSAARIAAFLQPVSQDFTLPSPTPNGVSLSAAARAALLAQTGAQPFFSRELCAKYFTYMNADGQAHFVLYDDDSTLAAKLAQLAGCGVQNVFALFPDAAGLLKPQT